MGLQEELLEVERLAGFVEDEELLGVLYGWVKGMGITGRQGILFVTQHRVGLSVIAGWFEGEEAVWLTHDAVKQAYGEEKLVVSGLEGNSLEIGDIEDGSGPLESVRELIESHRKEVVRSDLESTWQEGVEALQNERFDEALSKAKRLLKRQKECRPALRLEMWSLLGKEDLEKALRTCRTLLSTGPLDASDARAFEARVLRHQNKPEEALVAATTSLQIRPSDDAYTERALAHLMLGRPEAALTDARQAALLAPDEPTVWKTLFVCAQEADEREEFQRCIDAFERLELEREAHRCRALLAALEERHGEVLELAQPLLEEDPTDDVLVRALLISASETETDLATGWLSKLDGVHTGEQWYEFMASLVLVTAGRAREAQSRWNRLDPEVRRQLGKGLGDLVSASAYLEAGASDKAVATVEALLRDDSWITDEEGEKTAGNVAFVGAKAALKEGRPDLAREWLKRAESLSPEHVWWDAEEMTGLVREAHAASAGGEAEGEAVASRTEPVSTYELLGLLLERLEDADNLRSMATQARELLGRFDQPPLISVMGEYSVGKSTFINALLGRELLPTGEGVTTGTITWLRYGDENRMRVVFRDGRVLEHESLLAVDEAVREAGDGHTPRDVRHVEVFLSDPVLRHVNIVDTPGLNAPFPEHQDTTEAFLAESDAIIFLFNVESAGKATEALFLEKLKAHARKAVAVVNQIDLVDPDEVEEVLEALAEDFDASFTHVHGVSALRALRAVAAEDDRALRRSRMPELRGWLEANLLSAARRIKEDATRAKVRELIGEVQALHQDFEERVEKQLTELRALGDRLRDWSKDRLNTAIDSAAVRLRTGIREELDRFAVSMAEASTPEQMVPHPIVQGHGQSLLVNVRAAWKALENELIEEYNRETAPAFTALEGFSSQWAGAIERSTTELNVDLRAWRKDLRDYLEQAEQFAEGYVEGNGIVWSLSQVPLGSHHQPAVLRDKLHEDLDFLVARPSQAAHRWRRELTGDFGERFDRLHREVRAAAVEIRNGSFRKVESLSGLA